MKNIEMTDFALRHFDPKFSGTKILDMEPEVFIDKLNKYCLSLNSHEGYSSFCKLFTIPNFTSARTGTIEITLENCQYLRSGYNKRRDGELPVLTRWFNLPTLTPKANFLMIVLYSRDQLILEHKAEHKNDTSYIPLNMEAEWGVVSINAQINEKEDPMTPATMIRNALGKNEGGSGSPLDKEKYKEAVEFWNTHAVVN